MSQPKSHYDVYCKNRGYLCSQISYDATLKTLSLMYSEHFKHFRKLCAQGKKVPPFQVYAIERIGNTTKAITFHPEINSDDDRNLPDYEDVKNG